MAHILVVDADTLFSALVRRALEHKKHRVVLATDAKTGRDRLNAETFDALVCDIILPDETGLRVLHEARGANAAMALIAISGGRPSGHQVPADVANLVHTFGVDAMVNKPCELSAVVATIEDAIERRHATSAGA